MSDSDVLLVRVLGATDAIHLPIRDRTGRANENVYLARKAFGSRGVSVIVGGDPTTRKTGERLLAEVSEAGLLVVASDSAKAAGCKLTAAGEARARALVGFPDRREGRELLGRVAGIARKYEMGHCPEIDLNDGKGWGKATLEDRRALAWIEATALAALVPGWLTANTTLAGHACYAPTEAGLAELKAPSADPTGPLPPRDPDAVALYREVQDARLRELSTARTETREIGPLYLPLGAFLEPAA